MAMGKNRTAKKKKPKKKVMMRGGTKQAKRLGAMVGKTETPPKSRRKK